MIVAAFLLGLAGSLHCAGMCGPIAIALPSGSAAAGAEDGAHHAGARQAILPKALYQFGRVFTYTVLGLIVGASGNVLAFAGLGRTLSMVSGIGIALVITLQLFWHREISFLAGFKRLIAPIQNKLGRLLNHRSKRAHFAVGLLNGLLPCGLVTTALMASLGEGSIIQSGTFMAAFGLGTVPLMSAIAIGGIALPCSIRQRLRHAAPVAALVLAALLFVRGLSLGIPMVSPAHTSTAPTVCCGR